MQVLTNVLYHSLSDCIIIAIIFFFLMVVCGIFAQVMFSGFTFACSDDGQGLRVSYIASRCNPSTDPARCDPRGYRRAPKVQWREDCRGNYYSYFAQTKTTTTAVQGQIWGLNYYVSKGARTEIMRPRVWSREDNHNFDTFSSTLHTMFQAKTLILHISESVAVCDAVASEANIQGNIPICKAYRKCVHACFQL